MRPRRHRPNFNPLSEDPSDWEGPEEEDYSEDDSEIQRYEDNRDREPTDQEMDALDKQLEDKIDRLYEWN